MRKAWLLCCVAGFAPAAWADPVTYSEALSRAVNGAPSIAAREAAAESARLAIGPAGQLPDPQLTLGVDNYPVTGPASFRPGREDMTMMTAGIMQDMPSDALRQARTGIAAADAKQAEAELAVARLEARLSTAAAWIELYAAQEKLKILKAIADDTAKLERVTSARLASASGSADAALAAKMDAARIADQIATAEAEADAARAELTRWIGPFGNDGVGPELPAFTIDPAGLERDLDHHLVLVDAGASLERARAGMELARAGTQPDWSWSLMYGHRDDDFGDMVSVGVKFSLPLFQASRQSPMIDSKRADVTRASAERDALKRKHEAELGAGLARHRALTDRLARMKSSVLPLAQQREDLAAAANAAGTLPASDLIAARRAKHEVQLERLDLERELALTDAQLTLEYGEGRS
jgi:outer membrane protein TolC